MRLAKFADSDRNECVALVEDGVLIPLRLDPGETLADLITLKDAINVIDLKRSDERISIEDSTLWLPPIDRQEVWAAGVTYRRSQTARMEESEAAASCYDRVYQADRPELFFKATPHRVCGHQQPLRIRRDSSWNVPEPEITLVISPTMEIVGLTVGNDMSSRDIEGENPLYLPQAKCYDQCAGIGPWIVLFESLPPPDRIGVELRIERNGEIEYSQACSGDQMARTFESLVSWLARDNSFPGGVFLMTGTGVVPDNDFTLLPGDTVHITIDQVGTLSNPIIQN